MRLRKVLSFALCLVIILSLLIPVTAKAEKSKQKVVRVGWYESAFHHTDEFGRRSGYGYEYQQRVAIYAGWTYEYVEGSWPELLEMLMAGDLDLLSDVSYTEERAEKILYSAEAMGTEGYHVFIAPDNTEIRPDDFSTLNGKKVCVNKNSIQEQMFKDWSKDHNVTPKIVESTEKTPEMLEKLSNGEYDALVTLDTYGNSVDIVPICKVGQAESYFGINKERQDLKDDLDIAMNRLFEDNRDFNQKLTEKYNKSGAVNSFLSQAELEWISGHRVIRVGYRDDFLPFCDVDDKTGMLTGTLADYLEFAKTCEKNATLNFETRAYATTEDAIKAMARGEIDCVFPLSLSAYDGEKYGVVITDPLVSAEMFAIVRTSDRQGISKDNKMSVAIVEGNPGYESFLKDKFPNWRIEPFKDAHSGFKAVEDGKADCAMVNNYRINYVSEECTRHKLSVLATGEDMEMSFAVERENDCLYSILNKTIRMMPETAVNSSLTSFGFKDKKVTFVDFLKENLLYFIAAIIIILLIVLLLIQKNVKTSAKMEEGQQIISEAEMDPLTNLYSRNFFLVYANRLYRENPDKPMDAVVMNIDRFHSVNAIHGRDFGDKVLEELGEEIQSFLNEDGGIASRFEADRFDIYCPHREDWQDIFERFQARLDGMLQNNSIHLRMGVKPWQEGMEPVPQFDRARIACNRMRGVFKQQVVIFDDAMELREERDQLLLNDLGRALKEHELEIYYQPKYNIQKEEPELSSAEALVRWQHPSLGLISPNEFISLFERSGQISTLDKYVWEEAARQIAEWRDKYGITLPVSVNLSRVDVFDPKLPDILDGIIKRYGLKPSELNLEVTESAYTENAEQLIRVINSLRKKGYGIEMDDFGSGFSSLNMLSAMPIDVLKMDMEFIRNIERNEKDFRLVELIIDIARYLKVPVIAEGVETDKQLQLLKGAGCDIVQGYYFSRPLPVDKFEQNIILSKR